jgi:hypothetical protein
MLVKVKKDKLAICLQWKTRASFVYLMSWYCLMIATFGIAVRYYLGTTADMCFAKRRQYGLWSGTSATYFRIYFYLLFIMFEQNGF